MNLKKKIARLTVVYDDGTTYEYTGSGIHNASTNWRTKLGQSTKIVAEWVEHKITWAEAPTEPEYLPKDLQIEKTKDLAVAIVLDGEKLRSENELFAGIADGKAFYHKLPTDWDRLFKEIWDEERGL